MMKIVFGPNRILMPLISCATVTTAGAATLRSKKFGGNIFGSFCMYAVVAAEREAKKYNPPEGRIFNKVYVIDFWRICFKTPEGCHVYSTETNPLAFCFS